MKSLSPQFLLQMAVVLVFLFLETPFISIAVGQQRTPQRGEAKVSVNNSSYEALLKEMIERERKLDEEDNASYYTRPVL